MGQKKPKHFRGCTTCYTLWLYSYRLLPGTRRAHPCAFCSSGSFSSPSPGSRTASHKQSSPKSSRSFGAGLEGTTRSPPGTSQRQIGQHPEAEARGSSSSSLPGVVSHPRAAEVKGGWHLVLNRWQKQQEAKIPRTPSSDVVLGVAFFFFFQAPLKTSASYKWSAGYFTTYYIDLI